MISIYLMRGIFCVHVVIFTKHKLSGLCLHNFIQVKMSWVFSSIANVSDVDKPIVSLSVVDGR